MSENGVKVGIAVASAGRAALLAELVSNLRSQTVSSPIAIASVPDAQSLPDESTMADWRVVTGTRGAAAQRNAALDALAGVDFVFFFDDDSVVRDDYIENAIEFFRSHPEVVGITGRVLLDGATRGEVSPDDARRALDDSEAVPLTKAWRASRTLYGCNFAFRVAGSGRIRFDDRLPLYSWLEDHDFARRLMRIGTLARVDDCVIVHRGATSGGRQAHARLGYSQMMNPIHLWRQGSFPLWLMAWEIFRPTAKNVARSLVGSERSWRRERLAANAMALGDALRGRITPERILDL